MYKGRLYLKDFLNKNLHIAPLRADNWTPGHVTAMEHITV